MKYNRILLTAVLVFTWMMTGSALAGQAEVSGYTAAESRFFIQSPAFKGQKGETQFSYVLAPEFRYRTDNRNHQFTLNPFFRVDSLDNERTHFDLREAYWRTAWDEWDLLVGVNKVFWGVTESRHLVDIINQTDGVEDIDEEDKLGQPMVLLGTLRNWGEAQLYLMPYFRERTFPDENGRLRTPIPVDGEAAAFESRMDERHLDLAVRYAHTFGDWDVGTTYFYGTSREPVLVLNADGTRLVPFYELIHQAGTDIQWTREEWLWKFEGILREGQGHLFGAAIGGFEYTLYQILNTTADLGLLLEYNWDGRDEIEAPATIFDDDLFFGSRLALNDVQDTEALFGTVVDTDHASTLLFVEAGRRIGNTWKIQVEGRFFLNDDDADPAAAFKQDDFINLALQRHF